MNELDILKKLSAAAGSPQPPRVQVTGRVLQTILQHPPRRENAWYAGMAAASIAAAVFICVLAVMSQSPENPLADLLGPATLVLQ